MGSYGSYEDAADGDGSTAAAGAKAAVMQAAVEATAELTLSGMHALSSFIEFQDRFCPQLGEPNEAEKQLQFAFESIELY